MEYKVEHCDIVFLLAPEIRSKELDTIVYHYPSSKVPMEPSVTTTLSHVHTIMYLTQSWFSQVDTVTLALIIVAPLSKTVIFT